MMKLIAVAAMVVCATVVNAASVNWGGAITAPNGTDPLAEGQIAVLIYSADPFSGAVTKLSGLSIGSTADNGGSVVSTHTLTADEVDYNNAVFAQTYDRAGESVDGYYAILIADATGSSASYADMGQISGTTALSAPTDLKLNPDWTTDEQLTQGGYTVTVDIPEPTSALMLMLGVGLMALRRRHA